MSIAVMPPLHIPFQNNWFRGCRRPLSWKYSEIALAVGFNILEVVNILKVAEYLASMSTYDVMLEVWEHARLPHCTGRDDISVETRDIADIINRHLLPLWASGSNRDCSS
jgi:hypothetical protein